MAKILNAKQKKTNLKKATQKKANKMYKKNLILKENKWMIWGVISGVAVFLYIILS